MARKIAMVRQQFDMKMHDQASEDLKYWLSKTPQERLAAVTFLVHQVLELDNEWTKQYLVAEN